MKPIIFLFSLFLGHSVLSQTVRGKVENQQHEALIGATILELGTSNGVLSDAQGLFNIKLSAEEGSLVISYNGYQPDTVSAYLAGEKHYQLKELPRELEEVTVRSTTTFLDDVAAKHVDVITEAELTKAACCNLSESFETNASVDVSFTDAISGTKTIQMLGLNGRYVQINRENVPHIRGLTGRYGLGFVPGTWIQSIDVGKGSGSVVNGYESMTGQINLELKKPENSEKLYLNAYVNAFGRLELNANHATSINDQWSAALLVHTNYFNSEIDQNEDGFLDLPKSKQLNFMNRYKFQSDHLVQQVGVAVMRDEKAGGQLGFDFGEDFRTSTEYGFLNETTRIEVFGKTGLLFPNKPYKGWGFIYSASYTDINGGYGRNNYLGEETTLYANSIYQNIIGNSFHQYKAGASILYDDFSEVFADSAFTRSEVVPGVYYEYTYLPNDRLTVVAGSRLDFHNLYGIYYTPRLHTRYQTSDATTLRLAVGKGYRTPNVIIENSNVLVSSRSLIMEEVPQPEVSWNLGGSLATSFPVGDQQLNLIADYFFTDFQNQLVYDLDASADELRIYNLRGRSFAHSFQVEANYLLGENISLKGAYKYYDVNATIDGQLRAVPFISTHRAFFNVEYATKYDKWKVDYTLHWYGSQRLPTTASNPEPLRSANRSPSYFHMNTQLSRGFRWGNIYLGAENLLGFTQDHPIIDAENPFGNEFDASIVWGPIVGRMVYAGLRFKIKN